MKKKYTLLNSSIEVEGTEELIKYIDSDIIEFPLYTKKPRTSAATTNKRTSGATTQYTAHKSGISSTFVALRIFGYRR